MERWEFEQRRSLPLEAKEIMAMDRIRSFIEKVGASFVSWSTGIDSLVAGDLARRVDPSIPFVFADTGLEYPENRNLLDIYDNVVRMTPHKDFRTVIKAYGYPVVSKEQSQRIYEYRTTKSEYMKKRLMYGVYSNGSTYLSGKISNKWKFLIDAPFPISHKCCEYLKKEPLRRYGKQTGRMVILGTRADESQTRIQSYLKNGCNVFTGKIQCRPLSVWTKEDVWNYIKKYNLVYSRAYDMGYDRTGCMFCPIGVQNEQEPNKFQKMQLTHPMLWRYCMDNLGLKEVLEYMGIPWENKRSGIKEAACSQEGE